MKEQDTVTEIQATDDELKKEFSKSLKTGKPYVFVGLVEKTCDNYRAMMSFHGSRPQLLALISIPLVDIAKTPEELETILEDLAAITRKLFRVNDGREEGVVWEEGVL